MKEKIEQKNAAAYEDHEDFLDLISQETYNDLLMAAMTLATDYERRDASEALTAIALGLRRDLTLRQLDDDFLLAWRYLTPEANRIKQEREEERKIVQSLKKNTTPKGERRMTTREFYKCSSCKKESAGAAECSYIRLCKAAAPAIPCQCPVGRPAEWELSSQCEIEMEEENGTRIDGSL